MRLAISVGDPLRGIGPLKSSDLPSPCFLKQRPDAQIRIFGDAAQFPGLACQHLACPQPPRLGQPSQDNAPYVIQSIERAVQAVLAQQADALVTAPISKDVLYSAGFSFLVIPSFWGIWPAMCQHI